MNSIHFTEQSLIFIDGIIPDTHCFIFKGHKFPFNYHYFKNFSIYFKQNQELESNKEIQIKKPEIDGIININDEIITRFIKFVQHEQPLSLNDENVIALNYLGNEYKIQNLIEHTNNYISNKIDHFIIQILQIHRSKAGISTENYERILSRNLKDNIKNDQLILFDVPFLYRILENYHKENRENQINLDDYFKFLFGCLNKHKKRASILFSFADFTQVPNEYLKHLINHYSNVFDFQFINASSIQQLVKDRINKPVNKERKKFVFLIIFVLLFFLLFSLIREKNKNAKLEKSFHELEDKFAIKVDGKIKARIESNQIIKGLIKITEKGGTLDRSRSRVIINRNNALELGESAYIDGRQI